MPITQFLSYLELERHYAQNTLVAYERDLRFFESFCAQEYGLEDISLASYALLRSWIVSMVDSGMGNNSVNRKVSSLKSYYKFTQKIGLIEKSPLAAHKSLKAPKKLAVPFSEKEMEAVLSLEVFGSDFEGLRDQLIIELLYATGMRRAELISLQLVNFDLDALQLKVIGKRNKERIIPVVSGLVPKIKAYLKARAALELVHDSQYFFLLVSGKKLYETLVYRLINHYFSKVSTKLKKSPHMLRHTFATHVLNRGADMQSVKELLGHASLASTQFYTQNSMATLKKAYMASHPRNKPN